MCVSLQNGKLYTKDLIICRAIIWSVFEKLSQQVKQHVFQCMKQKLARSSNNKLKTLRHPSSLTKASQ